MMSLRIRRSLTRSASAAPNTSGRMLSKKLAMSASTTQQRPRLTSTRIASSAWWALRPGRKPNEIPWLLAATTDENGAPGQARLCLVQ
jgi:hypothetical protein